MADKGLILPAGWVARVVQEPIDPGLIPEGSSPSLPADLSRQVAELLDREVASLFRGRMTADAGEYHSPGIAPRRGLWDCFCCGAPGRDLGCTMEKGCDCGPHLRRCCRKCPKHCQCPPPVPKSERRILLDDEEADRS